MKLTFKQWIEEPSNGWASKRDELNCQFAESGADREYDFDSEEEEYKEYERYLASFEDMPHIIVIGIIEIVCDPIRPKFEIEIIDDLQQIEEPQDRLIDNYVESRNDRFFRRLAGQREVLIMAGKI